MADPSFQATPVVLLIDEYDKPILDNLQRPESARAMREGLRNFYSVIKSLDPHLKFVLLTGVSKFSKSLRCWLRTLPTSCRIAGWAAAFPAPSRHGRASTGG